MVPTQGVTFPVCALIVQVPQRFAPKLPRTPFEQSRPAADATREGNGAVVTVNSITFPRTGAWR